MAKLERDAPVDMALVIKARGAFGIRNYRGQLYVSKWPRRRGSPKSELQQAWVQHFACLGGIWKWHDPRSFDEATKLAKGTGWFWRDVFTSAAHGKLMRLPGAIRVTTPTARVSRSTQDALVANVTETVSFEAVAWDNNRFYTPSEHTDRLTIRSSGLYLIGSECNFENSATDGSRALSIRVDGSNIIANTRGQDIANQDVILETLTIYYLEAGQYIDLRVVSTVASFVNNAHFWLVGITPEAIT